MSSAPAVGSAHAMTDVHFAPAVIADLERKVRIRRHYREIDNRKLASG